MIGHQVDLPVCPTPDADAAEHLAWPAAIVAAHVPASSALTQRLLCWQPTHSGLLHERAYGDFFTTTAA